jgi:polyprenyl-phospho-N-acetylgalactosaminyl synthase
MSKPNIAIIIPCHNEQKHIVNLLKDVQLVAKKMKLTVVVIDDGSTDDSYLLAKKGADYVLHHTINLGKGAALQTGCEFVFTKLACTHVIMMDADEQHSPSDLPRFIVAIRQGHRLVLGVRSLAGMPRKARFANQLSTMLIKLITGVLVPDIPSGYKALSVEMYSKLHWQASGYDVELAMAWQIARQRLPFAIIPIQTIYPDYVRGMTALDGIKVVLRIIGMR